MSRTPELRTARLVLRGVQQEDAAYIYAYARNPNVLRYTTGTPPQTLAEAEAFVEDLVECPANAHAWSIRLQEQEPVIGVIEFGVSHRGIGSVDYALAEPNWGQGLMTEAVRAVLDWGFRTYPMLDSVESAAMTANPASTRVQEKCGMTRLRTEYKTWLKFDDPVELAVCGISRAQWAEQQERVG